MADGVFQFKVPMPASPIRPGGRERFTLVYAIETSDGWVMVDTGMDSEEGFQALQEQILEAGLAPRDFSLIVMTHGHIDHFGLAARAQLLTRARLAIHRADATNPYVLAFDPKTAPPVADVLLEGGEELVPHSGLWTIWTPGHTPGHVCIHDRERKLLFSGDHVLPVTTPNVSRYPSDAGNPLRDFIDAHLALAKLDVTMVHPAHEHSFVDLRGRIDEIIAHHDQRAEEILAAAAGGPRTVEEIAARIAWRVGTWDEMRPETRTMAAWETAAHLHFLVEDGRLFKEERGPRVLTQALANALGTDRKHRIAMVGCGRLGRATLAIPELAESGYEIVAAFDADPRQVGQTIGGLTVEPVERLEDVIHSADITTAIVAVPPQYARGVIDRLAASGIGTIVSYAASNAHAPEHAHVIHVDAIRAFQSSIYTTA